MLDALHAVFSSFWAFMGALALVGAVGFFGAAFMAVVTAMALKRRSDPDHAGG
ncbi:hypothetical protein [Rhodobium gokarnense]|uniref:Uncharacterized protein n=1 Tax=Rhodobium gokarnense TaxID=364296 RepID=A0ABT3HH68_9HYPH|nr:hypothetical protein [Rhodobium gokarnense]MCW2309710.1 hypothetical protein [Rhodobium gokarnense]